MTSGGVLKPNFRSLFTIDSSNQYDLIATMTDNTEPYCGTYECVDNNGDPNFEKANASVASKYYNTVFWQWEPKDVTTVQFTVASQWK